MSQRKKGKAKAIGGAKPRATGPMDVGLLEQFVQLMSANDLNTVDVRDGDKRVILKRGPAVMQYGGAPMMSAPPSGAGSSLASQPSTGAAGASPSSADDAESKLIPIKSPMVGTFYLAPKQGEKPFVSAGSVVNEETDVCIIEAMKVFNVIKAETSGTIAKVMIQDGQPVEYGTVLFLVKPA